MKHKILQVVSAIVLLMSVSACTGSQHRLATVSDADIGKINKEITVRQKTVFPVFNRSHAANRALLARVHNRLAGKVRPLCDYTGFKNCFFQTIYNSSDKVNAIAHDNYKITVYGGLLQYLRTDDEVAMVIAHEMGHHLANHNQEKLQNAMVGAAVSGILTAVVLGAANHNNPYYGAAQQQRDQQTLRDMTNAGAAIGALSYSREEEREADLLGAYLLARAGYNLHASERTLWVLTRLKAAQGVTNDRSAFGDSHPSSPERIASWRNVMSEIKVNPTKLPYKAGRPEKAREPQQVAKQTKSKSDAKHQENKTVASRSTVGLPECMFSWQKAKDGSRCGKRAVSTKENKQTAFSE